MFALGNDFNLYNQAATGTVRVSLAKANGVTFVAIGATSGNCTVTEANAASGGTTQTLAKITAYWTQASGVWTKVTQAAAATFPLTAAGITVAELETTMLSDGYSYVYCNHATGTVMHIIRGLHVKRQPTSLVDLRA